MYFDYNFNFLHMTKNFKNLKNILKDGSIKLGSQIPMEDKYLSGYNGEPYIFSNIYFKDLDNLEWFNDLSLIIKPEIIEEQSIIFVSGWGNKIICTINPSDKHEEKINKLEEIKKYVSKPEDLPSVLLSSPKYMQHEVRFSSPINIKKYLDGIVIGYKNEIEKDKKISKVKKLLLKYNLEKVKIYSCDKKLI